MKQLFFLCLIFIPLACSKDSVQPQPSSPADAPPQASLLTGKWRLESFENDKGFYPVDSCRAGQTQCYNSIYYQFRSGGKVDVNYTYADGSTSTVASTYRVDDKELTISESARLQDYYRMEELNATRMILYHYLQKAKGKNDSIPNLTLTFFKE